MIIVEASLEINSGFDLKRYLSLLDDAERLYRRESSSGDREEVVGEIDVVLDFEEYLPRRRRSFKKLGDELYLMVSCLPFTEANEVLGTSLPTTESHTAGSLVMARLCHIPIG
jgi:hypothetical protein